MRLQVAQALVGTPSRGDEVRIVLLHGQVCRLAYIRHEMFDRYVWRFETAHLALAEAQAALRILVSKDIELDYVMCYVDAESPIIIGKPLSLVYVPYGNMRDWPRFQTTSVVDTIEIL